MNQTELFNVLKATGFPVAYSHFKTTVTPPYIVYLFTYSSDLIADNVNYHKISNFQVELYTETKNITAEEKLEQVFINNELPYEKSETWLEDEGLFQISYEIKIGA